MGEIYEGLCQLRNFLGVLWLISFVWLHFAKKKLYCHLNNVPFVLHIDWLIKVIRRTFLIMAFLPPYTFVNFLLFLYWYIAWKNVGRHKWELLFHRLRFRAVERMVLREEGLDGLIKLFGTCVENVSEYLGSLEPGSTRYNLTVNLYIKCQRRLEKMKRGENFGHFPIPK